MDSTILSIIVPIYNGEKYLKDCLDSLDRFDRDKVEVILVNDGSTDKSEDICKDFASDRANFRYFYKNNSGVSDSRNFGMANARGEYIAFVDCDDVVLPEFETCLKSLGGDDFYLFSLRLGYDLEHSSLGDYRLAEGENKVDNLYKIFDTGGWGPWAKIYRKRVIDVNGLKFKVGQIVREDQLFNLEYWEHIKTFMYVNNPVYLYRENHDSAVHVTKLKQVDDTLFMVKKFKDIEKFDNEVLTKTLTKCYRDIIRVVAKNCKYGNTVACKQRLLQYENEIECLRKDSNKAYLSSLDRIRAFLFEKHMYRVLALTVR